MPQTRVDPVRLRRHTMSPTTRVAMRYQRVRYAIHLVQNFLTRAHASQGRARRLILGNEARDTPAGQAIVQVAVELQTGALFRGKPGTRDTCTRHNATMSSPYPDVTIRDRTMERYLPLSVYGISWTVR